MGGGEDGSKCVIKSLSKYLFDLKEDREYSQLLTS